MPTDEPTEEPISSTTPQDEKPTSTPSTDEKHGLVKQPSYLAALSVQLGVDITPNQDLDQRLDGMVEGCKELVKELEGLRARVQEYEQTHDAVHPKK
jgi:hypothetical protein